MSRPAIPPSCRRRRYSILTLPAAVILAAAVWFTVPAAEARAVRIVSYQELLDKSDLVAIATASGRTTDTAQEIHLPGFSTIDAQGQVTQVKCRAVETQFVVSVVLKGDRSIQKFTLHHARWPQAQPVARGPLLVLFDPQDSRRSGSYLLFLVREPDGRYAPTDGQTDPALGVITRLPIEDTAARLRQPTQQNPRSSW
ncbi:hypothetical protein [Paludibaculum fermentans]|uniref:hypothetical protein n=1 Tax=Paludibaculum fermentans TaxID=1473598 RepID=UPI003EB7AC9C